MAGSQGYKSLRAMFLLSVCSSIGCATTDRNTQSLSVKHSLSDNVVCTISAGSAGAWNCDSVTPKTPIQKVSKNMTSSKKLNTSEAQDGSRSKKISNMNGLRLIAPK